MTHDAPFAELEIEGTASPCSYLPGKTARMIYRIAYDLSETRYEQLLSRGWRRFGRTLFRPVCAACRECRSLRVRLPDFVPNKNQRRCLTRNAGLTLTIQQPTVSDEHISLYNQYHLDMHHRRQWPCREITKDHYCESFLEGHFEFAREFQYRDNGRLIGLGLVDVTASAMSSIYFFLQSGISRWRPGNIFNSERDRRWTHKRTLMALHGLLHPRLRFDELQEPFSSSRDTAKLCRR